MYFHVQLKTAPCSDAYPGDWEILVVLLCQKVICNIQVRFAWYLLAYFVFFLNAIYLCEKQLRAERNTQHFSGEGVLIDMGCVVLHSSGLLPPSTFAKPWCDFSLL